MATISSGDISFDPSVNQALSSSPKGNQLLPKAKEFESILLGQWLQAAETSFGDVPGGNDDRDAGDDQFSSFAVQQLARRLTDSGGLGIATIVAKALEKDAAQTNSPAVKTSPTAVKGEDE